MVLLKYLKPAGKESVSVGTAYKSCMFPVSIRQGRVSPTDKFHTSIDVNENILARKLHICCKRIMAATVCM